jgi:hypothetical protein
MYSASAGMVAGTADGAAATATGVSCIGGAGEAGGAGGTACAGGTVEAGWAGD